MKFSTHQLVEVSLLIALAFVLDLTAKFYFGWFWVYGGSVSLSLVPLAILAYRHGWITGITGGLALGLLKLMMGPQIYHPVQVLFDYPLAFMALGLAGIWAKQVNHFQGHKQSFFIVLSTFVASMVRFVSHAFSGYIFFRQYTPEGMNPLIYTLVYNVGYVGASWILSALVLIAIYHRHQAIVKI